MQQRLVYRIEDADGLGPFQDELARVAINAERYNRDRENYPTPANDPGFDQDQMWEFVDRYGEYGRSDLPTIGCCSREQLQHWFDAAACKALAALGFFFAIFEVEDDRVIEGDFQAVFDRSVATIRERLPACALWDEDRQLGLPLAA